MFTCEFRFAGHTHRDHTVSNCKLAIISASIILASLTEVQLVNILLGNQTVMTIRRPK